MESVMKRQANRRTILLTAGVAAAATAVGTIPAQSADIRGTITFEGGAAVPKGHLEIYLEDAAIRDTARRRSAAARITSDGASKAIAFFLSPPTGPPASQTLRIVARLEREDGWLIARGSAQFDAGSPIIITLNAVVY